MTEQLLQQPEMHLSDLYGHILEHLDETPSDHLEIRNAILGHPASQKRLETASRVVMKRWAVHRDRQADLMQEAALSAAQQLAEKSPLFEPQGVDRFGGWLFCMWYSVCRDVWRRLYAEMAREPHVSGLMYEAIAPSGENGLPSITWSDVIRAIGEIEDTRLRNVMTDWANQRSGQDSAALRGLAESTISRQRRFGMRILRLKLQAVGDTR